jgi:mono/diheme cytochrome c family protein
MLAWEESDSRPDLPELPPQPKAETPKRTKPKQMQTALTTTVKDPLTPELRKLVKSNTIAEGGWLYTTNCYRCHLVYEKARMGKGLEKEIVFNFISGGKTSTQMTPFSRMLGGNLKNKEIKSIVDYITTWEKAGEPLAIAAELMTPPALDPSEFIPIRLARLKKINGDASSGKDIFLMKCSGCHGKEGEGYIGSSLQANGWSMRPDLYVKSVLKKGIPRSLMVTWDKGSNRLAPKEIDDVVSYVTHDIMGKK